MKRVKEKLRLFKQSIKNNRGFTFVELLIVITILAILATLAVNTFKGVTPDAKKKAVMINFRTFETALEIYYMNYSQYPTSEEGLQKLVSSGLIKNTKDVLMDPWGYPYNYRYPGNFSDKPEMWSNGADGKSGGEGENSDITNWEEY